jgi:hypothetical protein
MLVLLGGVLAWFHTFGGVLISVSHWFHTLDSVGIGK